MKKNNNNKKGSVLALMMISLVILSALGAGMMSVAYGVRHRAITIKNETASMLAAEAGYEQAIMWMSTQKDIYNSIKKGGGTGTHSFAKSKFTYAVTMHTAVKNRKVYKIVSTGTCALASKTVKVYVVQAMTGWEMGMCRIPKGTTTTSKVSFVGGEVIDMPLHINSYAAPGDGVRDIHVSSYGVPMFAGRVSMGESYVNSSKYPHRVMNMFNDGICFDQPKSLITDKSVIDEKLAIFKTDITNHDAKFIYKPTANANITNGLPTVQVEFYVDSSNKGQMKITDDCTTKGYHRLVTNDWKIDPDGNGKTYEKYDIYAYHYTDDTKPAVTYQIDDESIAGSPYLQPAYGGDKGAQIYVEGNVVIGGKRSEHSGKQVLQGKVTIVATGNIWIADSVYVSDKDKNGVSYPRDTRANGEKVPGKDNPNVLGLVAGGVIKVVDPGMSSYKKESQLPWYRRCGNYYPGKPIDVTGMKYAEVCNNGGSGYSNRKIEDSNKRVVVEAALTVGGGGWGAENINRSSGWNTYGGRKDAYGQDYIVVHGVIVEAIRGIVGSAGDGFNKRYYLDERMLEGIIPGDILMRGKLLPTPAGWHDYTTAAN